MAPIATIHAGIPWMGSESQRITVAPNTKARATSRPGGRDSAVLMTGMAPEGRNQDDHGPDAEKQKSKGERYAEDHPLDESDRLVPGDRGHSNAVGTAPDRSRDTSNVRSQHDSQNHGATNPAFLRLALENRLHCSEHHRCRGDIGHPHGQSGSRERRQCDKTQRTAS